MKIIFKIYQLKNTLTLVLFLILSMDVQSCDTNLNNIERIENCKIKYIENLQSEAFRVFESIPNLNLGPQKVDTVNIPFLLSFNRIVQKVKNDYPSDTKNKKSISDFIIGDWIRTSGCGNGDKMTQTFKSDGTGYVIVPDCNRTCEPFSYKMTFNWSTNGNTLTLEYLSVSEYCGVKQEAPGTFDMEFEATENSLRIVNDLYVRK